MSTKRTGVREVTAVPVTSLLPRKGVQRTLTHDLLGFEQEEVTPWPAAGRVQHTHPDDQVFERVPRCEVRFCVLHDHLPLEIKQ